jgi:hypothetical protein
VPVAPDGTVTAPPQASWVTGTRSLSLSVTLAPSRCAGYVSSASGPAGVSEFGPGGFSVTSGTTAVLSVKYLQSFGGLTWHTVTTSACASFT